MYLSGLLVCTPRNDWRKLDTGASKKCFHDLLISSVSSFMNNDIVNTCTVLPPTGTV